MPNAIELGLDTFGDVTIDAQGQPLTQAQVLRDVVTEGALADQVGLHFFGVGEHHRKDLSIVRTVKALGLSRFDMKYSNGTLPHDRLMKSIELYGRQVAPLVRESMSDGL